MEIGLDGHFTYRKLLRFVASPVLMMLFTSLYGVVDGFFVSNYVGSTGLAAVNLIWPLVMGVSTIGFMVGSGGSAVVSKTLGEGDRQRANSYFSLLIYVTAGVGLVLSVLFLFLIRPVSVALGASGPLLADCVSYGRWLTVFALPFILQVAFQSFLVTAGKPDLSLGFSIFGGAANMVLDWLFIVPLHMGVAGAALATGLGQVIGGVIPLVYFLGKNNSLLSLGRTKWNGWVLLKTCTNGASEMVTNLSTTVVQTLYNIRLMGLVGEAGVAAYGIILYVMFVFTALYYGYAMGAAPLVGFHFGARNRKELQSLFRKSIVLLLGAGVILTALAEAGLTLEDWRRQMPAVSRQSRSVAVSPALTGTILRDMARREKRVELGGGLRLFRDDGWAWICPEPDAPRFRIVAEAANEEYARELCDFCEGELKRIARKR